MQTPQPPPSDMLVVKDLQLSVEEAREALSAIRAGQVDALIIQQGQSQEVLLLQGADRAYQVLFETLNEGAATLDADGTILFANHRFAELCARPLDALRGTPLARVVDAADAATLSGLLAAAGHGDSKGELRLAQPDGAARPVMISLRRVELHHPFVTVVVSDLTPIKETQAELQRAHDNLVAALASLRAEMTRREQIEAELRDKAAALIAADRRKDEFLAMLAHELRNPLGPIRSAVELLRGELSGHPDMERHRLVIERQTRHLSRLVDDLLEASRIAGGVISLQRTLVDLSTLVRTALEDAQQLLKRHEHAVTLTFPGEPVWIEADPTRIHQVVLNLVKNAAQYTPPGGRIELVVTAAAGHARLLVRDNGSGIAPELLPHVFELFVQGQRPLARSQGGMGLGLTIVKRLIELHGGVVWAESDGPDRGSTFILELPLADGDHFAPLAAATPPESPSVSPPAGRILLIEDNIDGAEMLAEMVRSWGYDVAFALSGEDGLRRISELEPAVVLIDIGLPGLDGYEIARRLRLAEAADPGRTRRYLICMSGYGKPRDRQRADEAGFDRVLIKPLDPDQLRSILAKAIGRAEAV